MSSQLENMTSTCPSCKFQAFLGIMTSFLGAATWPLLWELSEHVLRVENMLLIHYYGLPVFRGKLNSSDSNNSHGTGATAAAPQLHHLDCSMALTFG